MVKRNLTLPFKFYCLTDNSEQINDEVRCIPIKHLWLEKWWNKLAMFEEGFGSLEGRCLYFDLDVIIQNNIDEIVDYQPNGLCKIHAYWKDESVIGVDYDMRRNSSCLTWNANELSEIWDYFLDNEDAILTKYVGIDRFLYWEDKMNQMVSTFPEEWFYSRFAGDGETKHDGLYYRPERKVCLLNGLDYSGYTEKEMLEGLEEYF